MKFDGTINIPTVVTVLGIALTGLGAFYNVKESQSINTLAIVTLKESDVRHELALRELKAEAGGPLSEIKQDIKDLRADIKEVRAEIRDQFKRGKR